MNSIEGLRRASAASQPSAAMGWPPAGTLADPRPVTMMLAGRTSEVLPEDLEPIHDSWDSFLLSWRMKFTLPLDVAHSLVNMDARVTANLLPYRHVAGKMNSSTVEFRHGTMSMDDIVKELDNNTSAFVKEIVIIVPRHVNFGRRASKYKDRFIFLMYPPLK